MGDLLNIVRSPSIMDKYLPDAAEHKCLKEYHWLFMVIVGDSCTRVRVFESNTSNRSGKVHFYAIVYCKIVLIAVRKDRKQIKKMAIQNAL